LVLGTPAAKSQLTCGAWRTSEHIGAKPHQCNSPGIIWDTDPFNQRHAKEMASLDGRCDQRADPACRHWRPHPLWAAQASTRSLESNRTNLRIPLIDVGTIKLIKQGELTVYPGIEQFTEMVSSLKVDEAGSLMPSFLQPDTSPASSSFNANPVSST